MTLKEGLRVPLDLTSVVIVAFQPLRACPKYSPADAEGLYFEGAARVSVTVTSVVVVVVNCSEQLVVWADASSETAGRLRLASMIVEWSVMNSVEVADWPRAIVETGVPTGSSVMKAVLWTNETVLGGVCPLNQLVVSLSTVKE